MPMACHSRLRGQIEDVRVLDAEDGVLHIEAVATQGGSIQARCGEEVVQGPAVAGNRGVFKGAEAPA